MQYRTHTCNELRLEDAGKQVRLSGWMENIREVSGNLALDAYMQRTEAGRRREAGPPERLDGEYP